MRKGTAKADKEMAIRKFRKHIKPFIWFITVLFVLSSGMLAYMNMRSSHERANNYAFKLNGKKIPKIEVEQAKNELSQGYSRYTNIDRELISLVAFDELINKKLTLELAKDLNVKVSNSEVNGQFKAIEGSVGDREEFRRHLMGMGYTKKTFKEDIKNSIIIERTLQTIKDSEKVTEDEIKKEYYQNRHTYEANNRDFSLEAVKTQVEESIKERKGLEKYFVLLEKKKKEAKVENISSEYQDLVRGVEISQDGIDITNVDIAKRAITSILKGSATTKEEATEIAKKEYEDMLKLAKKGISMGAKVPEEGPADYKLATVQKELLEIVKAGINPSEKELREFFKQYSLMFDTYPSAKADIVIIGLKPSQEDKEVAKKKASEILGSLTPENFKDKARVLSMGPSAPNGGELGWFGKGDMVEPFQEAAFKGEAGKIYPEVVETTFGYHLIFVEEKNDKEERVKASHILIIPKVSKETAEKTEKEIVDIKSKLASGEMEFKDISKDREDVVLNNTFSINNGGYIAGLGYEENLTKAIFDAPLNSVESLNSEDKIFIFKKLEEVKYKQAVFEEEKDVVLEYYKNIKAMEKLKNI